MEISLLTHQPVQNDSARGSACQDRSAELALMNRLASGEESAMTELTAEYGERLQRMLVRLCAWSDDADDLLQEVLLKVWQKANRFDGKGSLEGWLRQIAINQFRNHHRKRNSIQRMLKTFAGLATPVEHPADSQLDQIELTQHAMQRLGKADRSVLVLHYLEQLSIEDTARLLNISTDTLHVRLHRARKRMKTIVEKLEQP